MLVWLGFNGLVLLWFVGNLVFGTALRYRLVFWYGKWHFIVAMVIGALLIIIVGWGIAGLRRVFRRSKKLGGAAAVIWGVVAAALTGVAALVMTLGIMMGIHIEWRTDYFPSPEGTNTAVVFFGGDAGATTGGPYYAAYPMVCRGVYRYSKDNETDRVPLSFYEEYIAPDIDWPSERMAIVRCVGKEIVIEF